MRDTINISEHLKDAAIRLDLAAERCRREAEKHRRDAAYSGNGEAAWHTDDFTGERGAPRTVRARMEDEADLHEARATAFMSLAANAREGRLVIGTLPTPETGDLKSRKTAQNAWKMVQSEMPKVLGETLFNTAIHLGQYVDITPTREEAIAEKKDVDMFVAVREADIRKRILASKDPRNLGKVFETLDGADRRFGVRAGVDAGAARAAQQRMIGGSR